MEHTPARQTVISVRVDGESLQAIDLLVQAGLAQSRSDAAAQLIAIGMRSADDVLRQAQAVADQVQKMRVALLAAVKAKDAAGVQTLLERDPNVLRAWASGGDTPLLLSVYYGAQEITKLLLEGGADLNLFEAAAAGALEQVLRFLAEEPAAINTFSHDGWTPLHLAAHFGRQEVVDALLERGADPNAHSTNDLGNQPHHAALAGRRFAIARQLLALVDDVNAQDHYGWAALHHAAYSGDVSTVDALLARNARTDLRNCKGQTPADVAREQGHTELADRLMVAGSAPTNTTGDKDHGDE